MSRRHLRHILRTGLRIEIPEHMHRDLLAAARELMHLSRIRQFVLNRDRCGILGELAETFGSQFTAQDEAARLFLYRGDMYAEWLAYGNDAKRIATAFTAGINEPSSKNSSNICTTRLASFGFGSIRDPAGLATMLYPSSGQPPDHFPLRRAAAILSRVRSEMISRSN